MRGLACRGGGEGIRLEDIQAGKRGRYRSFVRLSLTTMQLNPVVRLLVWMSESQGEMYSHFVAKALWRLEPEVFLSVTPIVGRNKNIAHVDGTGSLCS